MVFLAHHTKPAAEPARLLSLHLRGWVSSGDTFRPNLLFSKLTDYGGIAINRSKNSTSILRGYHIIYWSEISLSSNLWSKPLKHLIQNSLYSFLWKWDITAKSFLIDLVSLIFCKYFKFHRGLVKIQMHSGKDSVKFRPVDGSMFEPGLETRFSCL